MPNVAGVEVSSQELRDISKDLEELPGTPAAGAVPGGGKGKGVRAVARKRHADAAPRAEGLVADDDDDAEAYISEEYLRQLCRTEFASMRSTITEEVSGSVSKTVGENHSSFMEMLSAMQAEVTKQSASIEKQVQSALAPRMDSLTRRIQQQIDDHSAKIAAAQITIDRHDDAIEKLTGQVAELRKQLALVAEAQESSSCPTVCLV